MADTRVLVAALVLGLAVRTSAQSLQTRPEVLGCTLEVGWPEIVVNGARFTTGGLGKAMIVHQFEVWVCDNDIEACASSTLKEPICYIYDEVDHVFVPWGAWRHVLGPMDATNEKKDGSGGGANSTARAAFLTFTTVEEISEVVCNGFACLGRVCSCDADHARHACCDADHALRCRPCSTLAARAGFTCCLAPDACQQQDVAGLTGGPSPGIWRSWRAGAGQQTKWRACTR